VSYFTPTRSAAHDMLAITCLPTWGRLFEAKSHVIFSLPHVGRQATRSEPVGVTSVDMWEIDDMPSEITKRTIAQAQTMRKDMTDGELKLWSELKQLKSLGLHVRKQVPIGAYIADFAILRKKLVIELMAIIMKPSIKRYMI